MPCPPGPWPVTSASPSRKNLPARLAPPPAVTSECLSAVASVVTNFPEPPPEVKAVLARDDSIKDMLCSLAPPASPGSQYASYSSRIDSLLAQNEDKLTACSAVCQGSATATAGGATRSGNAAARYTGVAAAVAVAGAALGAAML